MPEVFRRDFTKYLCYAAAMSAALTLPFGAQAAVSYECNLSGNTGNDIAGCPNTYDPSVMSTPSALPVMTDTNTPSLLDCNSGYCAASSDTSPAKAPIHAWNICRWVDNPHPQGVFVPFKSVLEWTEFLKATPTILGGISAIPCAVPYGSAPTTWVMPPFAGCTQISVMAPNFYGRGGASLYPTSKAAGPNFTCHTNMTTMMSLVQWAAENYPPDANIETPVKPILPYVNWKQDFLYSPDVTLTVTPAVVRRGQSVTINWYVAPYKVGNPVTCTPGLWGGPTSGPSTGSIRRTPSATTTYNLVCTEANTGLPVLTSTASANVTVLASGGVGGGYSSDG